MTRYARAVPVLMYHHISTSPGMITVSPGNFAAQMAYIARAGYTTIGAAQLAGFLSGHVRLPPKSVVLSFDDGYLDNWVHAHPVLQAHGQTALCFLVTRWIGEGPARTHAGVSTGSLPALLGHGEGDAAIKRGEPDRAILRWSEIHAMRESGTFEFHSHTHGHVRWDQVSASIDQKCAGLASDLDAARATLRERLGNVSDHLCWPQGYFDDDYQRIAAAAGFRYFYTCKAGSNYTQPDHANPCSITRLEVRDKPASWLASRLWIHARPAVSRAYLKIKR